MEKLKLGYLKEFCNRTMTCPKEIARIIEENEHKIRSCYSESFDISREDFVKMVLKDSTFIIELFLRADKKEKYKNDYLLSNPLLNRHILEDLILLENQLPFFILEELHEKFSKRHSENSLFIDLSRNYFYSCIKSIPKVMEKEKGKKKEVKHFTDLIRYFHCPTKHKDFGDSIRDLSTATQLYETGVIFKLDEVGGLLDIQFNKWYPTEICPCFTCSWLLNCLPCLKCFQCLERTQPLLKIPQFEIDDITEGLFRNIMAWEQCYYPSEAYLCNYMGLLDYLLDTGEDVELLVEKDIIVNSLGSNEAISKMVNRLCLEIVEENSCYSELAQKLNKHFDQCCNRNMGLLKSTYFSNLWRGIATIFGLIIFGFSLWSIIRPYVV
ncbi:UPF0481 protein At3g47200-like [Quercus lobata]|uniref:UPF0481 protein At3g47200-like n=1 Tax=Quercus lobata TaxID=97700 RepID=UPI001247FC24|nr:UPF0481 protein At3g47200-like [Quercus lobata]XP_030967076.1 UPF0481 protein At3g47200-like [Quercus lobata]